MPIIPPATIITKAFFFIFPCIRITHTSVWIIRAKTFRRSLKIQPVLSRDVAVFVILFNSFFIIQKIWLNVSSQTFKAIIKNFAPLFIKQIMLGRQKLHSNRNRIFLKMLFYRDLFSNRFLNFDRACCARCK